MCPPMYPEVAELTPCMLSKTASTHQKHPAPSVMVSSVVVSIDDKLGWDCPVHPERSKIKERRAAIGLTTPIS